MRSSRENNQKEIFTSAIQALKSGNLIAYPTEAVYGLGCDPFNEQAVLRLLKLKERSLEQGLILVASDWSQIEPLIGSISKIQYEQVNQTWPGAHTWAFPKSEKVPAWISGRFNSVAIRIPDHPIPINLTKEFGSPIVSTSANRHTMTPCKTYEEVIKCFGEEIDYVIPGAVGSYTRPSIIQDILTLEFYR